MPTSFWKTEACLDSLEHSWIRFSLAGMTSHQPWNDIDCDCCYGFNVLCSFIKDPTTFIVVLLTKNQRHSHKSGQLFWSLNARKYSNRKDCLHTLQISSTSQNSHQVKQRDLAQSFGCVAVEIIFTQLCNSVCPAELSVWMFLEQEMCFCHCMLTVQTKTHGIAVSQQWCPSPAAGRNVAGRQTGKF